MSNDPENKYDPRGGQLESSPVGLPVWALQWTGGPSSNFLRNMLMFECGVNVFKALLNEIGPIRTVDAIKPLNKAVGRRLPGLAHKRFGIHGNDVEAVVMPYYWFHCGTSNGNLKPLEIRDGMAVVELNACPVSALNAPPEICVAMSHTISEAMCEVVNPEYEFI
jgi:hypothetical protein